MTSERRITDAELRDSLRRQSPCSVGSRAARDLLRARRALRLVRTMLGDGEDFGLQPKGKAFLVDFGTKDICEVIDRAIGRSKAKR